MSKCGGHDGHGCDGGHDHDPAELGISYSLYKKIDLTNVECLNEAVENSGKDVFKPWEERLSTEKVNCSFHIYPSHSCMLLLIFTNI